MENDSQSLTPVRKLLRFLTPWKTRGDGKQQNPTGERSSMPEEDVSIRLTGDQALVLHDWISRFNESGDATFRDQAEEKVLWFIEGSLEKVLVAPFAPDYLELVSQARARVRDPED